VKHFSDQSQQSLNLFVKNMNWSWL